MLIPFEPTNSFCYRFARYKVLPDILALPQVQSGQPFRLVELVKNIIDLALTPDQQYATYARAQTGQLQTVIKTIKWYVPYIAKDNGILTSMGNGTYRLPDVLDVKEAAAEAEAQAEDSALEDGELETVEGEGFIYAFSFPALINQQGAFPIKIGMTAGDVEKRVAAQCQKSASFDNPVILGKWKVLRVGFVESAVHKMLAARGKWRENVPGAEWFDTTVSEIQSIIEFSGSLRT